MVPKRLARIKLLVALWTRPWTLCSVAVLAPMSYVGISAGFLYAPRDATTCPSVGRPPASPGETSSEHGRRREMTDEAALG